MSLSARLEMTICAPLSSVAAKSGDDDEGYEREHGGEVWPSAACI